MRSTETFKRTRLGDEVEVRFSQRASSAFPVPPTGLTRFEDARYARKRLAEDREGGGVPIRVLMSAELSLMVIEFDGLVTDDEFKRDVVPLVEDPAYTTLRLTLVDATTATRSDAPGDLVRGTARTVASHVDEKVEGGARIAMAAPSDVFFGLGRMYQALRSDSPVEVGVFRGLDAAEQWLGLEPGYRESMVDLQALETD